MTIKHVTKRVCCEIEQLFRPNIFTTCARVWGCMRSSFFRWLIKSFAQCDMSVDQVPGSRYHNNIEIVVSRRSVVRFLCKSMEEVGKIPRRQPSARHILIIPHRHLPKVKGYLYFWQWERVKKCHFLLCSSSLSALCITNHSDSSIAFSSHSQLYGT